MTDLKINMPTPGQIEVHFKKLTSPLYMAHLLDIVGAQVVSQTQRRIREEKRAPDGTPWADWSEAYAGGKHGAKAHSKHSTQLRESENHSLLMLFGHLVTSITHVVHPGEVEVGSNLAYAGVHQKGSKDGIPARPYLGFSEDNRNELSKTINDYLETLL